MAGVFAQNLTPGLSASTSSDPLDPAVQKAIIANPLQVEATQEQAQNQSIQEQYQAQASDITAGGDTAEANLYGEASSIAALNSLEALSASDIQQAQTQLQVGRTIGSQQAGIASAGFANSGTALDLFRSSKQQGLLDLQLDQVNGQLASNGYLAQEASANAEKEAATAAAGTASTTAAMAAQLSAANQTIATNEAASISAASQAVAPPGGAVNPLTGRPTGMVYAGH